MLFVSRLSSATRRSSLFLSATLALALPLVGSPSALAQKSAPPHAANETAKQAAILIETDAILKEVSKLRGLAVKRPVTSGFRTRPELEHDVIRDLDESTPSQEFESQAKLSIALGLLPPNYKLREEMIKILTEQISGYYNPKTGEFVLTESSNASADEQKIVIAHELTHALQDQHFNLRRFENPPPGDGDRNLAIHCLIEGDATVAMLAYGFKGAINIASLPVSLSELMQQMSESGLDASKTPAIAAAPKSIRASLLFPYAGGAGFVQALLKKGGWSAVSQAFTDLPETTEQVLHPEKYFAREHAMRITLAPCEKLLGDGWREVAADVNGEFGYRLILGQFLDSGVAKRAAEGWDGDACRLYENPKSKRSFLVQHTAWDAPEDAQEFFDAYVERTKRQRPGLRLTADASGVAQADAPDGALHIERRGRDVLILEGVPKSSDPATLAERFWKNDAKSKSGDAPKRAAARKTNFVN
jgi:hypothetical protein